MAVNIQAVAKNPKLLVVVGVGVVGGVILISKLRPKESAPVEVAPDVRTVVDASTLEREDENARKLDALMQEKNELERRAEEQRSAYQTQLDQLEVTRGSERDEFTRRLQEQASALGTQFESIRQGLEARIKALQDQIANTPRPQPITTQPPATSPLQPAPSTGPTPGSTPPQSGSPAPQPGGGFAQGGSNPSNNEKKEYPGLGKDYQMNCAGKPTVLLFNTFDELVADQRKKGLSSTSLARNCTAIAISGSTKWEVLGYDRLDNELWRGWVNITRVAWGLYPLTYDEMGRLQYLMRAAWPEIPNERAASFQSLTYARRIWEKYNLPYQCRQSANRIGQG